MSLKLDLLLESIEEINRCEETGEVLEEDAVYVASTVGTITLLAIIGGITRKIQTKVRNKKVKVYKEDMKKQRDELKKRLQYTLDEIGAGSVPDGSALKMRPGTDKALNAIVVAGNNYFNKVKMYTLTGDIDWDYDSYCELEDEFCDKCDKIVEKFIKTDKEWVDVPTDIINKVKEIVQMQWNVYYQICMCTDEDSAYYATRDIFEAALYPITRNIKVYLPKGTKHPELEKHDKLTKQNIENIKAGRKPISK